MILPPYSAKTKQATGCLPRVPCLSATHVKQICFTEGSEFFLQKQPSARLLKNVGSLWRLGHRLNQHTSPACKTRERRWLHFQVGSASCRQRLVPARPDRLDFIYGMRLLLMVLRSGIGASLRETSQGGATGVEHLSCLHSSARAHSGSVSE